VQSLSNERSPSDAATMAARRALALDGVGQFVSSGLVERRRAFVGRSADAGARARIANDVRGGLGEVPTGAVPSSLSHQRVGENVSRRLASSALRGGWHTHGRLDSIGFRHGERRLRVGGPVFFVEALQDDERGQIVATSVDATREKRRWLDGERFFGLPRYRELFRH
jgi:hypothetical protein